MDTVFYLLILRVLNKVIGYCFLFAYFACFKQMRLFLPCRVCFLSAYTYQGLAEQTRRWARKRLIWYVLDMLVGYCLKQVVLRVSALVPGGSKLPNRVRWPGGGIPYTFQNIPLCPGVVHKTVEESSEESMMYYLCY